MCLYIWQCRIIFQWCLPINIFVPEMSGNACLPAASPVDYIAKILKFGNLFFLPISLLKKCSMVQFKYIFLIVHVTELFSYVIHNSCYIIFYLVLRSSFSLWSLSVSYFLGELYTLKRWACFVIIYKKYFSRLAFVFWFFLRVLFLQNIYKFTNIVL